MPGQLVSRQATTQDVDTTLDHPAMAGFAQVAGINGHLPDVLQVCNAIASAGEMVPPAYRNKPGAVLLAKMWGDKHGIDLFTAMNNLDLIDGRTWVKTEMRIELATAKGFEFRVDESTRETCTVTVVREGVAVGSITANLDDRPRRMKTKSGAPTPWAIHPDDMLFAEACRKADRRYVRTAASLVDQGDYSDDDADPVAVVQDPPAAPTAEAPADEAVLVPTLNEVIAAAADKGIKPGRLKAAAAELGFTVDQMSELNDDDEAKTCLKDWIDQQR